MRKLFPVAIKLALAAMFILIPIGICFALDPSATIHAVQGHMSMPALVAAGAVVPALAAAGVLRPRAVPIKEACRLLGYKARSEVYILVKEGVLDAFKDGTKTLISIESIEAYNANLRPLKPEQFTEPAALAAAWARPDRKRGHKADSAVAAARSKPRTRSQERS
jgi:hypothetical protein